MMFGGRCTWYEIFQLFTIIFTILLLLSKYYESLGSIFKIFYETHFSIVCVIVGTFSIIHGIYVTFKSIQKKNFRELGEAGSIIACGIILISPLFNTVFTISFLSFITKIPEAIISHLSLGLIPVAVFYLLDMFKQNAD